VSNEKVEDFEVDYGDNADGVDVELDAAMSVDSDCAGKGGKSKDIGKANGNKDSGKAKGTNKGKGKGMVKGKAKGKTTAKEMPPPKEENSDDEWVKAEAPSKKPKEKAWPCAAAPNSRTSR